VLVSPLRNELPFGKDWKSVNKENSEKWTLKEIAIFEAGICKFGK
jgi:hypothetical protein